MQTEGLQITTLIPTYRRPQMLQRAVRSVLAQTYPHFQVCVFDNASGDETPEVVAALAREDARVKYFCQPENIGLMPNFNFAMQSVKTPFFSFLCDDDLLLPRFYETCMEGFSNHPEAMAATGTILSADEAATWVIPGPRMEREGLYSPPESLLAWTHDRRPLITAHMFRREVIPYVGGFSDDMTSDLDLELRCAAQFPYVVSFQPCGLVISHTTNATTVTKTNLKQWQESYEHTRAHLETLDVTDDIRTQVLRTMKQEFGGAIYSIGLMAISSGDFKLAHDCANEISGGYDMQDKAAFLRRMALLTGKISPLHMMYRLLHKTRTRLKRHNTQELQRKVAQYMRAPSPDIAF